MSLVNPRNSACSEYVHSASKPSETVYTPTFSEQCKIRNLDERWHLRTARCRIVRSGRPSDSHPRSIAISVIFRIRPFRGPVVPDCN
jgi:hypothetical protein